MTYHPAFIPVLTVMVDYGGAPFLWINESPDEPCYVTYNVSDGMYWYEEDDLMSEALWKRFSPWALEFDRTVYDDHALDPSRWDWATFHERGLQLTHWLKEEVGDTYRVVYSKPFEDPNHKQDEDREILAGGTVVPFHRDRESIELNR